MKKMISWMLAFGLILVMAACNKEDASEEKKERVPPVETAEATKGDLIAEKAVYGRTSPNSTTPIMMQSPGEIVSLEVEEGDDVEKNELLATIATPAGKQNIYASKAGKIMNLKAEEGSFITGEEPLAVIADMEKAKLEFSVTQAMREHFKKGDQHKIIVNGDKLNAEIIKVGAMPDDTGLYPVEAVTRSGEKEVLPGSIAEMAVPVKTVKNAIIIPTEALVEEEDETFVFIIADQKAVKTKVEVKATQSDKSAIAGDVKKGDQVVISGQLTLTDGNSVNVVKGE